MPKRSGQRQLTSRRPAAGRKDDPEGGSAIPGKALAADAKRARRRRRGRGAMEIVLDFLADFVANLLP